MCILWQYPHTRYAAVILSNLRHVLTHLRVINTYYGMFYTLSFMKTMPLKRQMCNVLRKHAIIGVNYPYTTMPVESIVLRLLLFAVNIVV